MFIDGSSSEHKKVSKEEFNDRPLIPEIPKASVQSTWAFENDPAYLIEMKHAHPAGNQFSDCDGQINVTLIPGSFAEKISYCKLCHKPVIINLSALSESLHLNYLGLLQKNLPPEYSTGLRRQIKEFSTHE